MEVDSYILPQCIAKPGSFSALMALYESNFLILNQLIDGLEVFSGASVSYSEQDCNLYFSIEKRTKYTCQFRLTYLFNEVNGYSADPDLLANVYFDARIVEVLSWSIDHQHSVLKSLDHRSSRDLGVCWNKNIMFSKWLDYLIENGHYFPKKTVSS